MEVTVKHKKLLIGSIAVICLITLGFGIYNNRRGAAQAAAAAQDAAAARPPAVIAALPQVTADGYVMPIRYASLSPSVPGIVTQIHVVEGGWVEAGAPLLTLENAAQSAALAAAQANLAQAAATLAQLEAGARPEEVAQAAAAVALAAARLERLTGGATAAEVATAQSAVAVAQANLGRIVAGPTPEQVTAADAAVRLAEASLKQAQANYDQVSWRGDIGRLPQSLQLEQATIEHDRAVANYQDLLDGPTPAEIAVYQAQVDQTQAALDELLAGAHPADVAAAQADLQAAQAALALVQAGPRPEEIAAAEAGVAAARSAVAQAQAALDQTTLRAPFAGAVSTVGVKAGEYTTPGMPAVRLGDTHGWVVETDNLSELDAVKLAVGDEIEVTLDALPGQTLRGRVTHIQPASQFKRGDVTYTATIALEPTDLPLRWGLTAAISLQ